MISSFRKACTRNGGGHRCPRPPAPLSVLQIYGVGLAVTLGELIRQALPHRGRCLVFPGESAALKADRLVALFGLDQAEALRFVEGFDDAKMLHDEFLL